MLSAFANSLKIPELRVRIFFTLGLIFICRIVSNVPTPGVDSAAITSIANQIQSKSGGGFLMLLDVFSGGALAKCRVGALSIWPYISASIILQLMTAVVPALERLAREGDAGRQKLTQYTRYLTLVLCVVQGFAAAMVVENLPKAANGVAVVADPGWKFRILTIIVMTCGTMLLMWLGEQVSSYGIGNGISIVITVNIVSRLPQAIRTGIEMFTTQDNFSYFHVIVLLAMFFAVIAATVALTQAQRRIPIHTTKRVVGRKVYGGQNTYMPLRVNYSGVMPIIFAQALLTLPIVGLQRIKRWDWCQSLAAAMSPDTWLYMTVYAAMILFFSYFWVATQFNPLQIADDLKKYGSYVPGIRPGRPTAEFLDKTMTRVTLIGAIFLTVIAVMPTVLMRQFKIHPLVASFFGGTSLLIIVGVALDTMRQVESHLLQRHYDGFLKKGRLGSRRR